MKITEITKSLFEDDLLVSEARELIIEIATEIINIMSKITLARNDKLKEVDSSIEFLESIIKRAIKEFDNDKSPDAEFIRKDCINVLAHIKERRSLL